MQGNLFNHYLGYQLGSEPKLPINFSNQQLVAQIPGTSSSVTENDLSDQPTMHKRGRPMVKKEDIKVKKQPEEITGKNTLGNTIGEPMEEKLARTSKKISKNSASIEGQNGKRRTRKTWEPQEDRLLIELVEKHGLNWALISQDMGRARTGKQIRDRYLNKLCPNINKGQWLPSEDEALVQLFKVHGRKWCEISKKLPGRTEVMVKNRFYTQFRHLLTENAAKEIKEMEGGSSPFASTESNQSSTALSDDLIDLSSTNCLNLGQNNPEASSEPNFQRAFLSEPLKTEFDDVPFIDFSEQTDRKKGFEEDLESEIFNNKTVEQRPANQYMYENNQYYPQYYGSMPNVYFNQGYSNSLQAPMYHLPYWGNFHYLN